MSTIANLNNNELQKAENLEFYHKFLLFNCSKLISIRGIGNKLSFLSAYLLISLSINQHHMKLMNCIMLNITKDERLLSFLFYNFNLQNKLFFTLKVLNFVTIPNHCNIHKKANRQMSVPESILICKFVLDEVTDTAVSRTPTMVRKVAIMMTISGHMQ